GPTLQPPGCTGRSDLPRTRGAPPRSPRTEQPGHRVRAAPQPGHRQEPRGPTADEARSARPHPGRDRRLRERLHHSGWIAGRAVHPEIRPRGGGSAARGPMPTPVPRSDDWRVEPVLAANLWRCADASQRDSNGADGMTSATDRDAAIVTRKLGKRFGRRTAVDGLDINGPRGTGLGFVGANAARTTTPICIL